MKSIKKFTGMFFAVLFILTAVPALVFFNFDRSAFTAEAYQKAFANADFYERLPAVMAEAIFSASTDKSQLPLVMRGMDKTAWEAFFRTMLPQEALQLMSDDILNSTFAYLNLQTNSIQFSLVPLKTSMVSDTGVQAVFSLLDTQAECTLLQMIQIATDLQTKSEIQLCKPPVEIYPMLTPVIQEQMQIATLAIPDQITLVYAPLENDPRVKLQTARLAMRFSPLLPLIFLLIMTFFAVNSIKSWLNWWGISFIITGLLASLMSLGSVPIFGSVFQRMLVSRMPVYLPTILLDYTGDLASAMVQALLNPILWQGLLITFLGLGMTGISYLARRKKITKTV